MHRHAHTHTDTHTHTVTCTHAHMQARMHARTYTQCRTHTHIFSLSLLPYIYPSLSPSLYRIVQISRPRLNYLIILGGLLLYISQALYIIPTKDEFGYHALGSVWAWTSSIGSSFCYGTIIMKMFRVYYVVHNPRPKKVNMP